jgi:hypothetical protein
MSLLLTVRRTLAGWFSGPASATPLDETRRLALRAVTLEQLRDSEWPCHPHF